jgi:protein NRD1
LRSPNRRGRSRSRSPQRGWDARGSPHNRDRGYNNYAHTSPQGGRGGRGGPEDRDRGRDNYRQRSPARGRGFTPEEEPEPQDKWVEYDSSLPNGTIKVLSRTLFVGGVTCSEAELRQVFSRHGKVQTCIVNKDKRHAFVKMYWRKDAVTAKEAMEENRNLDLPLRVSHGHNICYSSTTLTSFTDKMGRWVWPP